MESLNKGPTFSFSFMFKLVSSYIANKRRAHKSYAPGTSTAISPMTGISEKRVKVIVRTSRKSRQIGQHRITNTTQNQLCPNQRSQVTKMRHKHMPVHCQRMLRADVPAVNRFLGTSSSKKVTQDHEIVRNIGKRADYQNEVTRYLPSLP